MSTPLPIDVLPWFSTPRRTRQPTARRGRSPARCARQPWPQWWLRSSGQIPLPPPADVTLVPPEGTEPGVGDAGQACPFRPGWAGVGGVALSRAGRLPTGTQDSPRTGSVVAFDGGDDLGIDFLWRPAVPPPKRPSSRQRYAALSFRRRSAEEICNSWLHCVPSRTTVSPFPPVERKSSVKPLAPVDVARERPSDHPRV
jgi:hypothetical protein